MTGRRELHICQGNATGLHYADTMSLSLLLCPTPVGMGMHSSFKTTMQEPIVHVLSKTTCSFAESRLSHGQRSPQTCLQLTIWDIVGRRVRRRPHKPEDFNELADALQEEWHVVVSRAWWRMETPLAMETSVKLTC